MINQISYDRILARIKLRLNKYFEDVGRATMCDTEVMKEDCIDDIDTILERIKLDNKLLVLEQLEVDKE